jgi:hypothetical protein
LKAKCDEALSNFAFNFNLRRDITAGGAAVLLRAAAAAAAFTPAVVVDTTVPAAAQPALQALCQGRAVHVGTTKSTLKAPVTNRLTL